MAAPSTVPTLIALAKRGDLLVYPSTTSAVASLSAERAGIAKSHRTTVWNFAIVTNVNRKGEAIAFETFDSWSTTPRLCKGMVHGQLVAAAEKLKPLDVREFVLAHRQDYPSADAARKAVLAAVEAAKAAAAAQPQRYVAPDGLMWVCGTGPSAAEWREAMRQAYRIACHGAGAAIRTSARAQIDQLVEQSGRPLRDAMEVLDLDLGAYFASRPIDQQPAGEG